MIFLLERHPCRCHVSFREGIALESIEFRLIQWESYTNEFSCNLKLYDIEFSQVKYLCIHTCRTDHY